ncbi:MAG: hypothetical protein ACYTGA_13275 [Planctomycetota bacterium]
MHQASEVTDAVRWMMSAWTVWVASETVVATARASLIASAVPERCVCRESMGTPA